MSEPLLLGDGFEVEVEAPIPHMEIQAELPPFITTEEIDAILVSGPPGGQGPAGSPGPPGEAAELEVDPIWAYQSALT